MSTLILSLKTIILEKYFLKFPDIYSYTLLKKYFELDGFLENLKLIVDWRSIKFSE